MNEYYDASRPPDEQPDAITEAQGMAARDAEVRVRTVLDEARELVAVLEAEDAEREDEEEVDPELLALFASISGADDAPVVFQSLHRRVQEGRLTWEDVWHHPSRYDGGYQLLAAAVSAQVEAHREAAEEWFDQERPRPQ